jgi:hypothetical protein
VKIEDDQTVFLRRVFEIGKSVLAAEECCEGRFCHGANPSGTFRRIYGQWDPD